MLKANRKIDYTIRDVAKKAGVSLGTASQAMNKKPGVSEYTMQKVLAAAKALDYIPSITAQQLRGKKSNMLSLHIIVSDDGDIHPSTWVFYFPIIRGFTDRLNANNFKLHLEFNSISDLSTFSILLSYLKGYNIRGTAFIIVTKGEYSGILNIKNYSIPLITIYTKVFESISSISIDNYSASYKVTSWLRKLGHEKIAFIGGPCNDFAAIDRKNGYLQGIKGVDFIYAVEGTWDVESGYSLFKKMVSDGIMPTAIFCANDYMAMGAINACQELCIKIPDTISIVGFDDNVMCKVSNPQLTSVRMLLSEMGEKAAEMLINDINKRYMGPKHYLLPTKLIVRDSVRSLVDNAID